MTSKIESVRGKGIFDDAASLYRKGRFRYRQARMLFMVIASM